MSNVRQNAVDPWRRHKVMAIPILALVLAFMMYRNFARVGTSPPIAPPPRPARVPAPSMTVTSANQVTEHNATQWPKLSLDAIIAKNPFGPWNATIASSSATANQSNAAHGTSLRSADSKETPNSSEPVENRLNEKVQAVYHDATGTAAIVDSHIIRLGDKLDDGRQVTGIAEDGIIIEKR